ncbi:MAG TPA: tellurite resistance TerB family protein [Geminicoccaceae bacterium]|nr:tellurite resistance TerB family protein [Geminicoccaceae bacterium]
MRDSIDRHSALVYTMVLVSAAEGRMSDSELEIMTHIVRSLPVFSDFDTDRLLSVGRECAELLAQEEGLAVALDLIARALPQPLRETAYALACDVAAADGRASQAELRLLEMLRERLDLEPLVTGAIERAAQARFRVA